MGLYQMVMKAQQGRAVPVLNAHLVAKTCFLMERERVQPLAFGLEDWFPNGNRVSPATGFLNEILCGRHTVHKQTNKQTKQEKFEKNVEMYRQQSTFDNIIEGTKSLCKCMNAEKFLRFQKYIIRGSFLGLFSP